MANLNHLAGKTQDELLAIIAGMQKANQRKLTLKVSAKGAVSMYGMGKFPVTLYSQQWVKLLDMADDIRAFIEVNQGVLSVKD